MLIGPIKVKEEERGGGDATSVSNLSIPIPSYLPLPHLVHNLCQGVEGLVLGKGEGLEGDGLRREKGALDRLGAGGSTEN